MEKLLTDIDELFAHLEDFTHGKDGEYISDMRRRIAIALKQYNNTGKICEHTRKDYVRGMVGSHTFCQDCGEKLS